jgi:sugar lactone lactonase YvrE
MLAIVESSTRKTATAIRSRRSRARRSNGDVAATGSPGRVAAVAIVTPPSANQRFGGPDLDVAYVTSMARAVKGASPKEREAGALFAVHGLGVRGLPEPRFAG